MNFIINKDTENGYEYVETSQTWKQICSTLPCFAEMWWPDYLTKVIRTTISGEPVIIQLWKGWCQRFGGRWDAFPGGMGAEVGIYRKVNDDEPHSGRYLFKKPVKKIDKGLHHFRTTLEKPARHIGPLKHMAGYLPPRQASDGNPEGEVWYPYPELRTWLQFKLVNPWTQEEFFETRAQQTYWLTRWMAPYSYRHKYPDAKKPPFAADFRLHYTINGVPQEPW